MLVERLGGVGLIRFNRPEALNALDLAAKTALLAALEDLSADPGVRCVVLTGTGRAFCVGQDLREHVTGLEQGGPESVLATVPDHYNPIAVLLHTMPKPVIAAVNGVAAGAGASLAFLADLRLVAASAGFNLAFAQIGLSCDTGCSWTLPRLVGPTTALRLLYLGGTISAEESLRLGIATEVIPDDEFEERVLDVAGRLAAGPDPGVRGDASVGGVRSAQLAGRGARVRGGDDGAHRGDRGSPTGRRRLPGQAAAGVHRPARLTLPSARRLVAKPARITGSSKPASRVGSAPPTTSKISVQRTSVPPAAAGTQLEGARSAEVRARVQHLEDAVLGAGRRLPRRDGEAIEQTDGQPAQPDAREGLATDAQTLLLLADHPDGGEGDPARLTRPVHQHRPDGRRWRGDGVRDPEIDAHGWGSPPLSTAAYGSRSASCASRSAIR